MDLKNKCLVCNNVDNTFYLRCKDHFTSGESFEIYRCNNCGFLFTASPPSESEIGNYYNTGEYISHSDTKKGIINSLFHIVRSMMLYRKRNIIQNVTGLNSGTLLDIGTGTGYFPAFMKNNGWTVKGLEINDSAREYAHEKFGLEVISENELAEIKEGQYDCVTLWHVLEHFHDPEKYLTRIKFILKDHGVCILAIPNSDSFDAKHFKKYWAAYDVPRHLWHFNPDNFRLFSEKAGFITEKIMALPFDVFYISILSEKYRGSKISFLTGLLKALLFALLSVFNKKKNSSVIYILRKKVG